MPGFLDQKRIKEGEIFKHIIMVLPHIDDCHVLKKLLIDKNIIDDDPESDEYRKIIVATERRTAKDKDARKLDPEATDSTSLNQALWSLENKGKRSLTITVNRFLTGVSVPLWDAMFYMKDTASPQEYDQAIFRLCTRNVGNATYTDENGVEQKQKICRKANVYLIDFKVDRMYNMMVNSAVSQCGADKAKKHNIEEVKELINKSIEQVPTYVDSVYDTNGKHILNGIHEITADDLLKQYVKYNRERSIEDSIDLKQFNSFLDNLDNMKYIQRWSEGLLNQTKLEQKEGSDELPVDDKGFDSAVDKAQEKSGNVSKADKKDKAELETMKKKFTTMLKSVLYSCICMNNIPEDIMNYIELVCSDSECEQIAKDFKIDVDELSDIISRMNDAEIMQINMLIYQLKCLLDDKNLKPIQRVSNAISKLGQLDKNEVVTGSDLVNKMLDKLGDRDMSGKSILEVNSKYGEFLIQIYERYGKEVANNVKVVASSDMTKNFIRKVLNILKLDEYNLIELEDYNGNGIYDIKDFVEAPNEKILKYNNMKKWDVCLMNPPYSNGNDGLHLQFTEKCINLADNTICLMPFSFISVKSATNKKYIPKLEKQLVDVVEIDSNAFIDTHMANVGIYTFSSIAPTNISITYLDNKSIKVKTLNDIQQFDKYEIQIETIIKNNGSNSCVSTPYYEKNNLNIATNISKTFPNNKTILVCSSVNGKIDAKFFSNKIGQIFNVNNEFINFLMSSTSLTPYNYLLFDNNIAAKNCKNALLNPLMRFFQQKLKIIKECLKANVLNIFQILIGQIHEL